MPAVFKHVPVTRMYKNRPVVATVSFGGLRAGEVLPPMPFSRLRRILARGWAVYQDGVENTEPTVEPDSDQTVSGNSGEGEDEPKAVSAEEGNQGWWLVTFSDGSKKNMRRSSVEDLGLIEKEDL